jgi:hypothetical protein
MCQHFVEAREHKKKLAFIVTYIPPCPSALLSPLSLSTFNFLPSFHLSFENKNI